MNRATRNAFARLVWRMADQEARLRQRSGRVGHTWRSRMQYCLGVARWAKLKRSGARTGQLPAFALPLRPFAHTWAWCRADVVRYREEMQYQRGNVAADAADVVRPLNKLVTAERDLAKPAAERPRCGRELCRWGHTCDRHAYHGGPCKSVMGCGGASATSQARGGK